ncbi:SDR family oxidoreductase [Flavobacterium johnsoniae]|uniref:Short-chain dehydrogenase/reductase SDR n=1 Tax=Flavobacterium johnsoniae (strain ATCC 17061 / DSM 2064 / JCM 8514 / BCRC 14874 / CCUG 350202 / NBRC 14942 / NCIMB 11054 / UW101) TaxID=376686 RepID=A5FD86_FLAJ1|nr:SDR family oxidoreductase [Flavobacterium johnsoniae]ABQ06837.1 short-chain dehydrogenase/reductase SDR [Flavobacterium johnsoniae UW101]OXE97302.1 short-chain dehydrogenase [Flavobacterium johnsoniae UW101]WQG81329.1 SDR family oxidoreductase [Flavobacterium johnsoniae UW101]SHL39224.1 NADP-dependent 3-hydroxy acid dehydrogenase YdfG [Flavobacterium johnsoniae]
MQNIENKTAYITGGAKGIGFGIAEALVKNGVKVAISGRDTDALEKAQQALGKQNVLILQSDIRNFNDERKAVEHIVSEFGKLDIVIANAGIGKFAPIDEMSLEEWNTMIDTNLTGAFHTLKAAVEQLKENKGYYISIASLAGANFFAKGAGYNASKFGLVGFTQAAMLDLRDYDVKCTTIMPGSVTSNFNSHIPSEEDKWKIQPSDIGQMVVDLLRMNPNVLPSKIEVRPTKTK